MMAIGREPADAGARRRQQPQFRPRQVASADQQHRSGLQIEKYRQKSHATLASQTSGVDWNYFLYMSRSMPAKRKFFLLYCTATVEFSPLEAKGERCIFSTTIRENSGCPGLTRPSQFRCGNFQPVDACRRRQWITSTRWKRRASTFSAKLSRG